MYPLRTLIIFILILAIYFGLFAVVAKSAREAGKKAGFYFLALVPMACSFVLQVIVAIVVEVGAIVNLMASGISSPDGLTNAVMELATDSSFLLKITVIVHICQVILGIIFYLTVFKVKPVNPAKHFSATSVPAILIGFIGIELVFSLLLNFAGYIFPKTMQEYGELIESTGIADLTPLAAFATLVLAPIGEEILMRGMTVRILKKCTDKFFVINVIQDLLFGILHANLVQGIYAFILGLVLGYTAKRYNTIYASMLAHLAFNFSGTFIVSWLFGSEEETLGVSTILLTLGIALVCLAIGYVLLKRDKPYVETPEEVLIPAEQPAEPME